MKQLLSDEWVAASADALAGLRAPEGGEGLGDVVIDYVVSGTPDGTRAIGVTLRDGRVTEMAVGKSPDPDVVVSMKYPVAVSILTGETTADAGYMNGALKVEGAHARWMLDLRPTRLAAVEALADLMAHTEV